MTKPLSDEAYTAKWIARVIANADRDSDGCLIWRGHGTRNGYCETNYRGKTIRVHRQLYKIMHEWDLPASVDVCHRCDKRRCIEIKHLWAGTRKQNLIDCLEKGRHYRDNLTHCKHGHEFTPENTEIRRSGPRLGAGRACKACQRIKHRMKAGWTREQAESMPITPPGQRPINGKFHRKRSRAAQSEEASQ